MDIVLASASPRRQELLRRVGVSFRVVPSDIDESVTTSMTPSELVEHLALSKARHVAQQYPGALVLGADTIVVLNGQVLGKPAGRAEAVAMLERLQDRVHHVYTGVALVLEDRVQVSHEHTAVQFRPLTRAQIERYVDTGEPMDKAGAYGIQERGSALVRSIEGDYFTVVGLPICRTVQMLSDFGVEIL